MVGIENHTFVSKLKNNSIYGTLPYELRVVITNLGYQLTLKSPEGEIIENNGIVVTNGTVYFPSDLKDIVFRIVFVYQPQEYDWLD